MNCAKHIRKVLLREGLDNVKYTTSLQCKTSPGYVSTFSLQNNKTNAGLKKVKIVLKFPDAAFLTKKTLLLVAFTPNKRFSIDKTAPKETVDSHKIVQFVQHTGDL